MKKIIVVLVLLMALTLTACDDTKSELDYSDFDSQHLGSFAELENIDEEIYIGYYYSETCGFCQQVKEELLTFVKDFNDVNFYLLDVVNAEGSSQLTEYSGTPTVIVMKDGVVFESFSGVTEVREFIAKYSNYSIAFFNDDITYGNIPTEYSEFDHLSNYSELTTQEGDFYIAYYYSETCGYCAMIKDFVFEFAYVNKDVVDIYFINVYDIDGVNPVQSLGTPSIFIIENGEIKETISGAVSVPAYLNDIDGAVPVLTHQYTDFSKTINAFADITTDSNEWRYVYVYNESCGYCNQIKQKALGFFKDVVGVEVYLLDTQTLTDAPYTDFVGTPTLYLIDNSNTIIETFVGTFEIGEHIQDYKDGLVTYGE